MNNSDPPDRTIIRVSVGLEEGPDGAVRVHALNLAGCSGGGPDRHTALSEFEHELREWLAFLAVEGEIAHAGDAEITVDEWIRTDADVGGGASNVFFEADRRPVDEGELARGIRLLGRLRGRLVPRIRRSRDQDLENDGSCGPSARLILDELARAQWWLLTRLGASPLAAVPERVVGRLDTAMALIVQHLGHLPESARGTVLELDGEEWSARKVLRRLLWLEWALGGAALRALNARPGAAR
jgi:hypothetical protein